MAGVSDENNNAEFGAVVRSNRVVVVANPSWPNHEPAGSAAAAYRAVRAAKTARFTESRRRRYLRINARQTPLVFQPRPPRIPIIPPPSPPPRRCFWLQSDLLLSKAPRRLRLFF